jgi:hypothetical protein
MTFARTAAVLTLTLVLASAVPALARQAVTQADITRLQDGVSAAYGDLGELRSRDAGAARTLQGDLDELREEVIYLKVKLRKEGSVPRAEFLDMRDRLDDLRARATSAGARTGSRVVDPGSQAPGAAPSTPATPRTAPTPSTPAEPRVTPGVVLDEPAPPSRTTTRSSTGDSTVPVGTELDVRLATPLDSGAAQVEDRFEATTVVDLRQDGRVLIPAGSVVRGVVTAVKSAGRVERKGSLSLSFDQITVNGQSYPLRATVTETFESKGMGRTEAERGAVGGVVGGILGGLLGGTKGAIAGVLIGGGGTIIATEGQEVKIPAGTVLRMRIDSPLAIGR